MEDSLTTDKFHLRGARKMFPLKAMTTPTCGCGKEIVQGIGVTRQ